MIETTKFIFQPVTRALSLVAFCLGSSSTLAIETTLSEDQSQLTVSGFELGTPPEVAVHDDFESGVEGQNLVGWDLGSSNGLVPIYSADTSISGSLSGVSRFIGGNYNSTAEYKSLRGMRSIYLSYYFKIDHISGDLSRNIKLARLSSGYGSSYDAPMTGFTSFANNGSGIAYLNKGAGTDMLTTWTGSYADGKWHRAEHLIVLSSYAGSADGQITIRIDGKSVVNQSGIATEMTGSSFEWLTLPYYVSHDPGGDYNVYYDNVHLASNQARVEICESAVADECSTPLVADISSWNENTVILNAQLIDASRVQYLHIYDNTGNLINQDGLLVCTKCPRSPTIRIE